MTAARKLTAEQLAALEEQYLQACAQMGYKLGTDLEDLFRHYWRNGAQVKALQQPVRQEPARFRIENGHPR